VTTQVKADEIGHSIGEIGRNADNEAIANAFGMVNRDAYMIAANEYGRVIPWNELTQETRDPWIEAARAVLCEAEKLAKAMGGEE